MTGTFSNLDFENMGVNGHYYSSDDWAIHYATYQDKIVNSYNLGFASEAFLVESNIDTSYDPSLSFLDGRVISGSYSYFLWGMHPTRYPDGSPLEFKIAEISQSGVFPTNTRSIQFAYRNDQPSLFINGLQLSLIEISPGILAADVTSYAGMTNEIRFRAEATVFSMIDDVGFSPVSIPEPSSIVLFLLALAMTYRSLHRQHK